MVTLLLGWYQNKIISHKKYSSLISIKSIVVFFILGLMFQFTKNFANVFIALQYPVEAAETQELESSSLHLIGPLDFITVIKDKKTAKLNFLPLVLFLHDLSDCLARSVTRICVRQGRTKVEFIKNKDVEILGAWPIARLVSAVFLLGYLFGSRARVFEEAGESVH